MTTLAEEQAEQERWVLRPQFAAMPWFDRLVENEFRSPDELAARGDAQLRKVVRFCALEVPYYSAMFSRMTGDAIRTAGYLPRLPILTRWELIEHFESLRATRLPPGTKIFGEFKSSGTTGRPTRVVMSVESNLMFTLLGHRFARWHRVDPMGTKAEIRAASLLPPHLDGRPAAPTDEIHWPFWRYIGQFCQTGPYHAIGLAHDSARLVEWLNRIDAHYLVTYLGVMEEMAFAHPDSSPCPSLRGLISVASELSEPMCRRVEHSFGLRPTASYGLNEMGVVASQCRQGRYHVHVEHCLVEIVDGEGAPCPPGVRGRVLVTGLRNMAMPLLRYDTDDSAVWCADACPCGRTLPSFTALVGRVRRYAVLPEGTRKKWDVLSAALEAAPVEMIRDLRRYQVHQHRDGRWELRIVSTRPLGADFHVWIKAAWSRGGTDDHSPLTIVQVNAIPESRSGKRDDFTSDYFQDAAADPHAD